MSVLRGRGVHIVDVMYVRTRDPKGGEQRHEVRDLGGHSGLALGLGSQRGGDAGRHLRHLVPPRHRPLGVSRDRAHRGM